MLAAAPASAQPGVASDSGTALARVTLAARDTSVRRAAPGATLTAAFVVHNNDTTARALLERVAAPPAWAVVTGPAELTLGAGETDAWIVGVAVPANAAAGAYVVRVAVASAGGDTLRATLPVEVLAHSAVDLSVVASPEYAVASTAYSVLFEVHNQGNAQIGRAHV